MDACVGSCSFIGSDAMIREGLDLLAHTVIGAGKRGLGWSLQDKR